MLLLVDFYTIVATTSLILQITVLLILISGYFLKRKSKFKQHGIVMLSAVILHAITIFAVMIPSFAIALIPEYIIKNPSDIVSILSILHGPLGLVAFLLGLWLVSTWRLRKDIRKCFARKNIMVATITIWITTLILGIMIFFYFYGPVLFS